MSAAWFSGLERRFYDDHDKMLHDDYRCLAESGKQQIKEVKKKIQPENLEIKATPKRVWICPMHSASTACDRRIKLKKNCFCECLLVVLCKQHA